jgi:hypothetical protein
MVKQHLLFSEHFNRKHVRQMLAYPYSHIHFIQTHFQSPYQLHGETKLNKSNIQDLPLNLISLLEVYKQLMHCFIVCPFFLSNICSVVDLLQQNPHQ